MRVRSRGPHEILTTIGAWAAATAFYLGSGVAFAQSAVESPPPSVSQGRPKYEQLRDEEDWSFLRERSRRSDFWDPAKFISLGSRSFLSIGGELRQRYERFENDTWGSEPLDPNGYLLERIVFHGDLSLGRKFRFFGQVKSGFEMGRRNGPRPADENRLDLHQAYVEVRAPVLSTGTTLSVRAGRQELNLGSARLVSVREGLNVRQSFDMFRMIIRNEKWRVDTFISRPATTAAGVFDDKTDPDRALWGIYAVRSHAATQQKIDLYYLGFDRRRTQFDQGVADERRHSAGVRISGQGLHIDHNFELIAQWGRFGDAKIRAWTVASDTGYRFHIAGSPRIGLRADVTSGDRSRTDDVLGTFNPLFPRGGYFGLIAPTGPLNHSDLHPSVAFSVGDSILLSGSWLFFWRTERDDGLYGVSGNLVRSGEGRSARFAGHCPGVEIKWQATRHLSATVNLSLFTAGRFLQQAPPDRTIRYLAVWSSYLF